MGIHVVCEGGRISERIRVVARGDSSVELQGEIVGCGEGGCSLGVTPTMIQMCEKSMPAHVDGHS